MKHRSWIYYVFGFTVILYVLAQAVVYAISKMSISVPYWAYVLENVTKWTLAAVVYGMGLITILILHVHKGVKIALIIIYVFLVLMLLGWLPFMDALFAKL